MCSQHLPGPGTREKKGYDVFNELVGKGYVVGDYGLNVNNIDAAFDRIEKAAEAQFNVASDGLSDWLASGDSMTVFKGASAVDMVFKGDPEDEGVDEGLEETPDRGPMEQASDDTEGVVGENNETPQTEEAEKEDRDESNAETGLVGEPEEKGWQSFNEMVSKGFVVEEKGRVSEGAKRAWEFTKNTSKKVGGHVKRHKKKYIAGGVLATAGAGGGAQRRGNGDRPGRGCADHRHQQLFLRAISFSLPEVRPCRTIDVLFCSTTGIPAYPILLTIL